jgi:hypothetical protein
VRFERGIRRSCGGRARGTPWILPRSPAGVCGPFAGLRTYCTLS